MDVRLRCCSRPPRRRLAFSRHAGVLLGLPRGVGPSKRPSARTVHSSAIDDGVLRARSVRPSSEPTLVANTARSSDRMRIAHRCISHGSLSLHVSLAARLRFSVQEYPVCALNMLRKKSATHIPVYQRHWTWCGALYIHGSLRARRERPSHRSLSVPCGPHGSVSRMRHGAALADSERAEQHSAGHVRIDSSRSQPRCAAEAPGASAQRSCCRGGRRRQSRAACGSGRTCRACRRTRGARSSCCCTHSRPARAPARSRAPPAPRTQRRGRARPEQVLWPDLHVRRAARQRGQHVGVVDRDRGRRRRAEESHQKPP